MNIKRTADELHVIDHINGESKCLLSGRMDDRKHSNTSVGSIQNSRMRYDLKNDMKGYLQWRVVREPLKNLIQISRRYFISLGE